MSWKEKLLFLAPQSQESEVQGTVYRFYPMSVGMAFEMRGAAKGLAKALTNIFTDKTKDVETVERSLPTDKRNAEGLVLYDREVIVRAADAKTLDLRARQREEGIVHLIETFGDPDNQRLLAKMIIDSLRDIFPPGDSGNPTPDAFLKESGTLNAFPEMLMGLAKANKKVLDPLQKSLGVDGLGAKIKAQVQGRLKPQAETDGSPSRIASSSASRKDTPSET